MGGVPKKGGRGWSVVGVPDSALVPEGAGVRAAGGLYVGVCVCEACGFVCGVGELLGWYGAVYAVYAISSLDTG